jgi:DNA primase
MLSRVDIIEVVGRYVPLKKAGIHHKGLCPFHNEKSPSFTVSPTRQTYHCFGCGVHGDVLRFLMEHTGLGFMDAVKDLAQQAGLVVPEAPRSAIDLAQDHQRKQERQSLTEILFKAAHHYGQQLQAHAPAEQYLQQRGLSAEMIERFGLGYAPPGWRFLANVFTTYDDPLLEQSGLVLAPESTLEISPSSPTKLKRYDRFRDRIMFPIRSVKGEVIGFGGRVLRQGEPKYLNSPETPVFSKGHELYGLFEGKHAIRQKGYVLVVEGYMDVVALAQTGFGNVAATLGTACTAEHLQKLFRFADSVVFAFDGDAAGLRAADRALTAALPYVNDQRSVRFLFLPSEHDPDSYVRQNGAVAFEEVVSQALPLSQQMLNVAREDLDLGSVEGRAQFLAKIKPMWSTLKESGFKRQMQMECARMGGMSLQDLTDLWQSSLFSGSKPRSSTQLDHFAGSAIDQALKAPSKAGNARPNVRLNAGVSLSRPVSKRWASRTPPPSRVDQVLRLLLLHSEWWHQLTHDDHDLLHRMSGWHGQWCAWFERQISDFGPQSWAVLNQALPEQEWRSWAQSLVTVSVMEDDMSIKDLHHLINHLWLEEIAEQQKKIIEKAASDPKALEQWRELENERRKRLQAPV